MPEAKKAVQQGCAVVIGLQTTGEAAADSMGLEPGQSCGSVSTTKQMLWHFVATHFPLKRETQKNGEPYARLEEHLAAASSDRSIMKGRQNKRKTCVTCAFGAGSCLWQAHDCCVAYLDRWPDIS